MEYCRTNSVSEVRADLLPLQHSQRPPVSSGTCLGILCSLAWCKIIRILLLKHADMPPMEATHWDSDYIETRLRPGERPNVPSLQISKTCSNKLAYQQYPSIYQHVMRWLNFNGRTNWIEYLSITPKSFLIVRGPIRLINCYHWFGHQNIDQRQVRGTK
jgi:hypothetical protein